MALGKIIEREMGVQVRYYGDVYHVLNTPVVDFRNEAVQQLTLADLELLESAPKEIQSVRVMLSGGIAACAIISDRIVGIAHTSARTDGYADIGAFTLEDWRGRGFATAAASIVARRVQESGQIPTWSAGEDNFASLRVAQKLGFIEVFRRTYLIPRQR